MTPLEQRARAILDRAAPFTPSPDWMPGEGDEPRVTLSRDNPCRPLPAPPVVGEG